MIPQGRRQHRVGQAIRSLISGLLLKGFRDPRIQGMITVTQVEMTPDLKLARVYVSILNKGEELSQKSQKECLKGLKTATPFIRSQMGEVLDLRYMPYIEFKIDESINYSQKLDELFKKI